MSHLSRRHTEVVVGSGVVVVSGMVVESSVVVIYRIERIRNLLKSSKQCRNSVFMFKRVYHPSVSSKFYHQS